MAFHQLLGVLAGKTLMFEHQNFVASKNIISPETTINQCISSWWFHANVFGG